MWAAAGGMAAPLRVARPPGPGGVVPHCQGNRASADKRPLDPSRWAEPRTNPDWSGFCGVNPGFLGSFRDAAAGA